MEVTYAPGMSSDVTPYAKQWGGALRLDANPAASSERKVYEGPGAESRMGGSVAV